MGANPSINLSADAGWATFVIGGFEFEAEVYEVVDLLADVDAKHRNDLHRCLSCSHEFAVPAELYGKADQYACPACEARAQDGKIKFSQLYLDDVVSLLKSKFNVPRCSRTEAYAFYSKIVELSDSLKKTTGSTPS